MGNKWMDDFKGIVGDLKRPMSCFDNVKSIVPRTLSKHKRSRRDTTKSVA